ncbi:hypothetical protein FHS43_000930 [Streptosporangium becharense]|uniref:Uncharacterized protein n=1 Tax=Streptosporangium becharense TaxID=1816182 RepID=A0A7W9IEQ3_9ACTN|nr:hypothetical protein [Streptosporangium becharense]MBB5819360.1 hypothetical protein [Streptosporangium becharense]
MLTAGSSWRRQGGGLDQVHIIAAPGGGLMTYPLGAMSELQQHRMPPPSEEIA